MINSHDGYTINSPIFLQISGPAVHAPIWLPAVASIDKDLTGSRALSLRYPSSWSHPGMSITAVNQDNILVN